MNKLKFHVVIPARMSSIRLPGKMLLDVCGLPLIVRVAKQALKSSAAQVVVATDHQDIFDVCKSHDLQVIMTSDKHESGTDRIAEVATKLGLADDEIIVNVQGDEPLIDPKLIDELAIFIAKQKTAIATLAHEIHDEAEIFNSNVVKLITNKHNHALYFSRASIPFYRDGYNQTPRKLSDKLPVLRHIGIYAYMVEFLKIYQSLPPCALEQIEALEQLRALYNGYAISVLEVTTPPAAGVDTLEDLERVRAYLSKSI